MAAIINFPKEATIWRRRRDAKSKFEHSGPGKVLLFSGVQYSRNKQRAAQTAKENALVDQEPDVESK